MKILFVCTGNTCRSAMAEGLARKMLEDRAGEKANIAVSSAGVAARPGDRATREAVEALAGLAVELGEHRASPLTPGKAWEADLILTMTGAHREYVKSMIPEAKGKVFTLAEYAGTAEDVPDPIGMPPEVYHKCALRLKDLIARALDRIKK